MNSEHFEMRLRERDPLVFNALELDKSQQKSRLELIASENTFSRACLESLGYLIANKAVEGYPGQRYHAGSEIADILEAAAIDRAKQLFGCSYVNAQPHSGTQANQAVYLALLQPGDVILSMDLNAGGHLSHGARASMPGRWFNVRHYGVDRTSEQIDYEQVERLARELKPQLIVAGGSAYPRHIDFSRFRTIADDVGAYFLVDMAHFGGLVAAGAHPSPVKYADVITTTLCKTMRGGPGAIILSNRTDIAKKLQSAVFPGLQGGAQMQAIAAKAVTLLEAQQPEFKDYGQRVVSNAKALSSTLSNRGLRVVTGGTDTHLLLVDLTTYGLTGNEAQNLLERAWINVNSNPIPFDSQRPSEWVGIRLGTSAGTTRGFSQADFEAIGETIADLLAAARDGSTDGTLQKVKEYVEMLTNEYPWFQHG